MKTPTTPIQDTTESEVSHSTVFSVQGTSNSVNSSSLIQTTLERASNMVRASISDGLYSRLNRSQRKKASSALTTPRKRPLSENTKKIKSKSKAVGYALLKCHDIEQPFCFEMGFHNCRWHSNASGGR